MKLRNKRTGEIVEYDSFGFRRGLSNGWEDFIPNADSLTELNEEWEDYEPKEPLIKDENIRKAVRAWSEVNSIVKVVYSETTSGSVCSLEDKGGDYYCMELVGCIPTLKDCETYTIAELCGEEE